MQLLDATLAMVLTLAALATIVSIFMEAVLRIVRMRKKNLVEVMKLLNKELDKGSLKLKPEQRWKFISSVIENPANVITVELARRWEPKPEIKSKPENETNEKEKQTDTNKPLLDSELTDDKLKHYLSLLGHGKSAGRSRLYRAFMFLGQFFGDRKRATLYDKVSMEHVLRRLVEVDTVQDLSRSSSETVKTELNRLARKYEEFGSAVSASFKRYAQAWSIIVGVLFAIGANVDGLLIFETYKADTELSKAIIAQQKNFELQHESAINRQKEFEKTNNNVKAIEKDVNDLKRNSNSDSKNKSDATETENELKKKEAELTKAKMILDEMVSIDQIKQTTMKAQQQLTDLVSLGIPLGWKFYPNCPYGDSEEKWISADPRCRAILKKRRDVQYQKSKDETKNTLGINDDSSAILKKMQDDKNLDANSETKKIVNVKSPDSSATKGYIQNVSNCISDWLNSNNSVARVLSTARYDTGGFFQWLFSVIVTGVLIGLGAPFWFDIAKRLAQVRQGVRKMASSENRMAANNADGDPKKRKEIVENVVNDAAGDAAGRRVLMK